MMSLKILEVLNFCSIAIQEPNISETQVYKPRCPGLHPVLALI